MTPDQSTSQWSADPAHPVHVSNLGGDQAAPHIVTTTSDDIFVAWFSNPPGRQNYDLRMQRFDARGNPQWEENGRVISDHKSNSWISDFAFAKDADENLIVALQDMRDGNSNLYAYKFTQDGDPPWGKDGIKLTDTEGFVGPFPSVVATPDYIILVWGQDESDVMQLRLQKLTPDGKKLWGDDGLLMPGQSEAVSYMRAVMIPGGDDEIILVYGEVKDPRSQMMAVYAQKLDKDGNSLWNDGQPVLLHESVPFYTSPDVVSDGAGGAYVGWYTTDLMSFVQHLDADGQLLMPAGGAPVAASGQNLQLAPRLQFDPDKARLYVFWIATDRNQNKKGLKAQAMSATGDLLWGDDGLTLIDLSSADLDMVTPRLSGEHIVVFYAQGDASREVRGERLLAMLLDSEGQSVWKQPAILASAMTGKRDLVVDRIDDQEWIAVWADDGGADNDRGSDILMQNLPITHLTQLANPASVFCEEQGGKLEIRTGEDGGQDGFCVFEDGSECEQWAFFRGECKPGQQN